VNGRILVTGATGFVGGAFVVRLLAEHRPFRAAVRHPAGLPDEVLIADIGPDTDWRAALDGIDTVVHLAGRAHVLNKEPDALAAFRRVNAAGTARLAAQARNAGVRRFILISSVKAAGESSGERLLVETDPPHPTTPYGLSKLEGEQAVLAAAGGMETVILRPPLVYGPGVRANFLALLKLIDDEIPLPFASVCNRRSIIALDNLLDAIITSIDMPCLAGVFYVADGLPLSTPVLIRQLAKELGKPARLFAFPPRLLKGAAMLAGRADAADSLLGSLAVDTNRFFAAANWDAPVKTEQALLDVASWYKATKGTA
jgi:nucleoside-diphosphate-sugar epimerase